MRWLIWRRGVVGLGATPWPYNASATLPTPQPVSRCGVVRSGRSGCFADALADFPMRRRGETTRRLLWRRHSGFPDATSWSCDALAALPTPWLVSQRGVGRAQRAGWFGRGVADFPTRRRGKTTRWLLCQRRGWFRNAPAGLLTPRLVCRRGVVLLDSASCAPDAPAGLPTPQRVSRRRVGGSRRSVGFCGATSWFWLWRRLLVGVTTTTAPDPPGSGWPVGFRSARGVRTACEPMPRSASQSASDEALGAGRRLW
jgi:hypothetical protein